MTVRKRLIWMMGGFGLLFLILILRLFSLQVLQSETLSRIGAQQWTRNGTVTARRGAIYDRNGRLLAQSTTAYIVCANPRLVKNPQAFAQAMADLLQLDAAVVAQKVVDTSKSSVILKRQVPRETVDTLRTLRERSPYRETQALEGLTFDEDTRRWYPYGAFLTQVLGLTNVDSVGQSGLEQRYEAYLAGQPGKIVGEVDAKARQLAGGQSEYVAPIPGDNLRLTVDQNLQSFMEKALRQCLDVNKARRVQAIMMDVHTGEILAMAVKPDYDPNDPPRQDVETLQALMRITAISDVYEPGSTFKILTTAAAIDAGVTTPEEGFYCSGKIQVDGDTIRCWSSAHRAESMKKALQNSCNPVFVELAMRLGTERFYRYLRAFGLGVPTDVDLPGEGQGILIGQRYLKNVDLARVGFGQSVAVTPLQLLTAACAAVNGGKLMRPYIVKEVQAQDGTVLERTQPRVVATPISPETSAVVRALLESVVEEGGGRNAALPGYRVGGKTGTAQIYRDGKIVRDAHIGSFLGFAPADDPRFALLVVVDEAGVQVDYGGTTAAPFAKQIIQDALTYYGIAPQLAPGTTARPDVRVPDVRGMSQADAARALREQGLTYLTDGEQPTVLGQMPLPGARMSVGSLVMLYVNGAQPPATQDFLSVPDVRGLSIVEANRTLRARGFIMRITGTGLAVRQKPAAGEFAAPATTVEVEFRVD
jgi:stage V sporulation protein D (sporulation-specific penicillin-binding protein)